MAENSNPTPHLQVVSGNPTPEELAVVVAVLQAAAASAVAAASAAESRRVASWHRNGTILRAPINPGHGQWTASVRRGLI
ncbi:MAG: hypothetical protein RL530_644 [Actinomycetota bacterium]